MKRNMAAIIDALSSGKVLKEHIYNYAMKKTKHSLTSIEMAAVMLSERKVIKITKTRMMLLPNGLEIYNKMKGEILYWR